MKKYDVASICNALYDVIYTAKESDLKRFGFEKGKMYLVDQKTQENLLARFGGGEKAGELGGSAMNVIRALAFLGRKVCFGGAVADDEYGRKIRSRMEELNIRHHLRTSQDEATGICMVLVTGDGERTMITYLGASRLYQRDLLPISVLQDAHYFHFCGYQWDTDEQKATISAATDFAMAGGTKISLDLADPLVVSQHKHDLIGMIESKADLVFANEAEAKLLYGEGPERTAERIAAGGRIAVIKLGARGALIARDSLQIMVKPVPANVVDTTAAGDMFAAGFLHGLCDHRPLRECGSIAARLASDVISRYGATFSEQVLSGLRSGF